MSRSYYSSPYYPTYGSSSGSGLYGRSTGAYRDTRSSTPGRSVTTMANSVLGGVLNEDRKREMRSLGLTPAVAPVAYKYFSRSDFYNPTVIFNRNMSRKQELKTVKTEDLDVESSSKETKRDHAIPGAIKRDTAVVAGGKQVIRLVTTKQKGNPYNIVGVRKDMDLTMGQKLAMKHYLADPKKAETVESDWSSDWTWETCSSSDEEGVMFFQSNDRKSWTKDTSSETKTTKKTTKSDTASVTSTASTTSVKTLNSSVINVKQAAEEVKPKSSDIKPYQSILQKYSKNVAQTQPKKDPEPRKDPTSRKANYDWLRPPKQQTLYKSSVAESEKKSSSSSTSSPPVIAKRYSGAGSKTIHFSSDDEDSDGIDFKSAWRKGQPPRSDCIVKLSNQPKPQKQRCVSELIQPTTTIVPSKMNRNSANLELASFSSTDRTTNKLLVSNTTPDMVSKEPKWPLPSHEQKHEPSPSTEGQERPSSIIIHSETPKEVKLEVIPKVIKKVTLPALSYATDSRIKTMEEEKTERLKVSYDPNVNSGTTTVVPDPISESVQCNPVPELMEDTTMRHNNSFDYGDETESCDGEDKTQLSISDGKSENYYPSDDDTCSSDSSICDNKIIMKPLKEEDPLKQTDDHAKKHKLEASQKKVSPPAKAAKQQSQSLNQASGSKVESVDKKIGEQSLKHENHYQMVRDNRKLASDDDTAKSRSDSFSSINSYSFGGSAESDAAIIASQLDRIPSPMRKMFEIKTKVAFGEEYLPEAPSEKPKYWNNQPKSPPAAVVNAFQEMTQMKSEQKRHQLKVKEEQIALLQSSEGEPEEAWYKDESADMQEQLQKRLENCERRPSDLNKPDDERKTPEENMAIIQLYGGIQFKDINLEPTPRTLLRKEFEESDEDFSAALSPPPPSISGGQQSQENEPPVKMRPKFRKYGVNDFKYLKVLGKGSFGKVILAELNDSNHSYYAIKCLRKDLVLEDDDIECTLIERKVLALGIKHPFLCHLFCTFQTDVSGFFHQMFK